MKDNNEIIRWHEIIQTILDKYLSYMSGKKIKESSREYKRYFEVDYYCEVEGELENKSNKNIVLPFDHLKTRNVIEYKSIHEVLNEKTFRHYSARALLVEVPDIRAQSHQGDVTLTIFTTRLPETLLATNNYKIEKINDWKYISKWLNDLDIYIIVQRGMEGKREGEALALLQLLEGNKKKQTINWSNILSQDLENGEIIKNFIEKINKENYMNIAQQLKEQGKIEGKLEELLKVLSWTAPELAQKYQKDLNNVRTVEELEQIEEKIKYEIQNGAMR